MAQIWIRVYSLPVTIFNDRHLVVGLGELLWDFLPGGKQLGGAPANFAYCAGLLGNESAVASRVGTDALGRMAITELRALALSTDYVQEDSIHSTGTVTVGIDEQGHPHFEIVDCVAWDFLELTAAWIGLAQRAHAVCFGSLAQRSEQSRQTIRNFLGDVKRHAVRVFDVNLRQSYFSKEVISMSLALCDIVKLNSEELPIVARILHLESNQSQKVMARALRAAYDLRMVCITRGNAGSLLLTEAGYHEHPGFEVRVADTVGAGDAFTAGLVHEYLLGSSLERMNLTANRMGAWVSTQVGAMPVPSRSLPEMLKAFD